MDLIFYEIPVFLLIAEKGKASLLRSSLIFISILIISIVILNKKHIQFQQKVYYPLVSSTLSLLLACLFFLRWHDSGRLGSAAEFLKMPKQQTCILIALLLALLSLVGIDHLIRLCVILITGRTDDKYYEPNEKFIILFIMLTAFLTMFLNSRCSPLYPFNDWQDPNTMFTVGKGVLKGYVPYRDLYEQKGPMLVFLHTIGALFSYDTFLGIWILELAACFVFLYFSYKTAFLFSNNKIFVIIPFLAAVIYSPFAFRAGDSAEEFALPLLAYALYIGSKSIKSQSVPTDTEFFIIGITSGFVFWMKYSMAGFYFGWFLGIILFTNRREIQKKLVSICILIFFGAAAASLPIILYFAANNSLKSLFQSYFYNNIVYYNSDLPLMLKLEIGFEICKSYFTGAMLLSLTGLIWLICRKRFKFMCFFLLTFISSYFFIFYGGPRGQYYCLPLGVFTIFGFCALYDIFSSNQLFSQEIRRNHTAFSSFSLLIGALLLCLFSHNLRFLEYSKKDMFPYKMKSIIEESGLSAPNILYYGIGDSGINTVAGLIPGIRYFCYYNNDNFTEIKEEQDMCIENQCADFIIARTKYNNVYPHFETYEHRKAIEGMGDVNLEYFHYFTPKSDINR